ncbi:MAG: RNA polymerase sigma factor [Ignavibacteria bacterium]|nr:RNA polymerase sigma factor [Ignavibacteria bacterium]
MPLVIETSTVQGLTDGELFEQLRRGSSGAFTQLYHRYKHKLYAYCYRMVGNAESTEDVVQETFLKIHRGIQSVKQPQHFRTWIFSVARNEALTHLRRTRHLEDLEGEAETVWDHNDPLEQLAERETTEFIQHYLGLLQPYYRELLVLREYEQLSYAEIAEITGITENAVKSALFKARKALAEKLEPILGSRKSDHE